MKGVAEEVEETRLQSERNVFLNFETFVPLSGGSETSSASRKVTYLAENTLPSSIVSTFGMDSETSQVNEVIREGVGDSPTRLLPHRR